MYGNGIDYMRIPPIKEDRKEFILKILECVDKNKFNREKMKKCILALYPNKTEKSVFRGIAIPTLRHLGLILGYDEYIRPSANGRLILESIYNEDLHQKSIRSVFLDIDRSKFGFIDILKKLNSKTIPYTIFKKNREGTEEYKRRWLKILKDCDLIKLSERNWQKRIIILVKDNISQTENNLDYRKKKDFFIKYLFEVYKKIGTKSAGILDIENLRGEVALEVLKKEKEIITAEQFDNLLREIPLVTNKYIISLGQPMGAEEKLFELNGKYYRTLSIKLFSNKEEEYVQ